MRDFLKKNGFFVILTVIFLVGVFLRAFNFSDWLHFELDQSRDAKVVALAVDQGIGNLPLLGPKAAGSFLRLGPIFYYFEYAGAKIFGNTPAGMAVPNLIFSCLTLPLFYLFARRYFDKKISVSLLLLFSVSLFLIMYSRFAWNPNNLPFFTLGFLYALLRATDAETARRGYWLMGSAVFLAIATQLHFVAFLSLPIIAAAYLLWKRPRINWKFWFASFLLVVFFYMPPIVNDIKTGGENIAEFQKVFDKKASDTDHSLVEKIIRGAEETSLGYFLILSGQEKAELPKIRTGFPANVDIVCDAQCRQNLPLGIVAVVIIFVALAAFGRSLVFGKNNQARHDFLVLTALWSMVFGALFVPIAYDLAPRFFLLAAPLPFVFLGFILEFLREKKMAWFGYALVGVLAMSNVWLVQKRFSELARAPRENFAIGSDKILKEHDRVTLEQQLSITDYLEEIYRKNSYPVYLNSEAFYRRAFLYHLQQRDIPSDDFRNTGKNVYARGNYFLVYPADKTPEEIARKYSDSYDLEGTKNFGTLMVVRLQPKTEAINSVQQQFGPAKKARSAKGVPVRCRWNEIFSECNPDEPESSED